MDATVKTVVTFKSSAFNVSEPKEHFINPCCFGDDVARWLAEQLRDKGCQAAYVPGQEDFGWYFSFLVAGIEYCFVIGHRPGDENGEGVWIGWLERSRGFVASMFGGRKRGIQPTAARLSMKSCRIHRKYEMSVGTSGAILMPVVKKWGRLPP